jgi:ATP-dependent helicase/nuclease subunit A
VRLSHFTGPQFLRLDSAADAAQVGTWTHEFLQFVDFSRRCDLKDLRAQLKELVTAQRMDSRATAHVDLNAAAWFFSTELGTRLRSNPSRIRREWPFVLGVHPSRYDPAAQAVDGGDVVLVRGIIDCLFDTGGGWEILDYKTDMVAGDELHRRADDYRGQLRIYAAAVEATWKQTPRKKWLVFLTPRQIVEAP